jgi:hypothetical protein
MFRRSIAPLIALTLIAGVLIAADKTPDKTYKATLIKVDLKKKVLYVKVEDEKKEYTVNSKTKFIGPKGGVSEAGIKDDRLKPGAEIELVIAANNKTVREVHLPERASLVK